MPAAADEIPLSPTPIPDHHRPKKRKIKSSSKRRCRRRRSSSPSSDEGTSRRKRSKKRKRSPSPNRRKDTMKKKSITTNKKKSRRRKPRRHDTSSDSSCSTCRSSSPEDGLRLRSHSPVRKVKPKVRGRSSGRERTRKNRYRSPSCSTCSSHSRSRSPSRERSKERKGRPKHPKTDFLDNDDRDKISISACSSDLLRSSQSSEDEGYGVGRWGDADEAAFTGNVNEMEQVVSSTANEAANDSCQENFGSAKDVSSRMTSVVVVSSLPAGNSDDIGDDPRGREPKPSKELSNAVDIAAGSNTLGGKDLEMILRQQALERFLRKRGGVPASSRTLGDGKDRTTSKDAEASVDVGSGSTKGPVKSVECKTTNSLGNHTHALGGGHLVTFGSKFVSRQVVNGSGDNVTSELAADQKISSSINNQNAQNRVRNMHESSKNLSPEQFLLPRGPMKSVECKPPSSLDDHSRTQEGNHPIKVGAKSVPNSVASCSGGNVTSKSADDHKISSSINNRSTQNQIKSVHESSNKMSLEQSSLPKDIQGKRAIAEPNGNTQGPEANLTDRSALGTSCLNTETGNCKSNEPVVEARTGSQFEQKTFSRMRDGEVVQVSYKVYIPKKRPAIARRQLQQ